MSTMLLPQKVIVSTLARGQGIAGPPGIDGSAGAEYIASAPVSGHMALAIDADGRVRYASCAALSDALRLVGISTGAAATGAAVTVRSAGLIEHSGWSWSPGPVYVGLGGVLTQALPVEAVFSRVVGMAAGATALLVDLQPPIVLT